MATAKRTKKNAALADVRKAELDKALIQPSIRTASLWTPALLNVALLSAENGSLFRVADLCEQILGDDRIAALIDSRVSALLGADLSFQKSSRRQIGDAELGPKLEEDWWDAYPEEELKQFLAWGHLLGVSFGEQVWSIGPSGRLVPSLKFWHPRAFSYDWAAQQWFVTLQTGERVLVTPGDGKWIVYAPRGRFRPWSQGLWRGISKLWLLKQYAISDWGVHSEKSAKLVATSNEFAVNNPGGDVGGGQDQRKQLASDIFEACKDAVIALPPGYDLKLVELTANTRDIYQAQIDFADTSAAIAIKGQNLTTEVKGGSFAAAQQHGKGETKLYAYDAQTASTTLHDQSLTWWAEFNFGDERKAPWPVWQVEEPEDAMSAATTLKALADALAAFKLAGYAVDAADIEERFDIKLTKVETPDPVATGVAPPKPGEKVPAVKPPAKTSILEAAEDAPRVGFESGQEYIDDVTDETTAHAEDSLATLIERMQSATDDGADYATLRAALLECYRAEEPPKRLAELLEHASTMCNLAGRKAVAEDA